MIDIGRKYFSLKELKALVHSMAFFFSSPICKSIFQKMKDFESSLNVFRRLYQPNI